MSTRIVSIAMMSLSILGLAACDVEKTKEGNVTMPKYEVEKKQQGDVTLPQYGVKTPDVAVSKEERKVEVPTVKKEERTVEVPKVEVTPAREK